MIKTFKNTSAAKEKNIIIHELHELHEFFFNFHFLIIHDIHLQHADKVLTDWQ